MNCTYFVTLERMIHLLMLIEGLESTAATADTLVQLCKSLSSDWFATQYYKTPCTFGGEDFTCAFTMKVSES